MSSQRIRCKCKSCGYVFMFDRHRALQHLDEPDGPFLIEPCPECHHDNWIKYEAP
jgi:ribosomal protein S27E